MLIFHYTCSKSHLRRAKMFNISLYVEQNDVLGAHIGDHLQRQPYAPKPLYLLRFGTCFNNLAGWLPNQKCVFPVVL